MLHENSGENYLYNNTNKQWCTKDNTKKTVSFLKIIQVEKKKKTNFEEKNTFLWIFKLSFFL